MSEKTLESPLESKDIKSINLKGNQPWMFIGRTDAEAEGPTLWPPGAKSWLTGEDPNAGIDWGQEEREQQRMRCLESITDSMDMNLSKLQQIVKDRGAWCDAVTKSRTWLSNWTQCKSDIKILNNCILLLLLPGLSLTFLKSYMYRGILHGREKPDINTNAVNWESKA